MDPSFITTFEWTHISSRLAFFWLFLLFIIGFAFSLLLAHSLIPSLITTRHLPVAVERFRRLFYLSAVGSLALALFFLSEALGIRDALRVIYPRWWI
ncbi:MAG: hypothetical protein ACE5IG_02805 [Dehalococcoidia bacterium]